MNLKKSLSPVVIKQKKFRDKRGFFQEIYLEKNFNLKVKFTATAYSKKNAIRGLHFQHRNKQSKLIYVSSGKILDVAVNLKKKSSNFGKVFKFILKEGDMIFIPEFYAHGYECLSKFSKVIYHLEKYRDPKNENGIPFNDKELKIKWRTKKPIVSKRDKTHNSMKDFVNKYKGL
tara:strand:- start:1274 stop:1795 length:522 start_codon:yes stop_codon:yes gene_type:complete